MSVAFDNFFSVSVDHWQCIIYVHVEKWQMRRNFKLSNRTRGQWRNRKNCMDCGARNSIGCQSPTRSHMQQWINEFCIFDILNLFFC